MSALLKRTEDTYASFLESKLVIVEPSGFNIDITDLPDTLFPFQKAIVQWALRRGRAATFIDTGTGKTRIQLVWANQIVQRTQGNILILAPLAVAQQTMREGIAIGVNVTVCRTQDDVQPGINITNYEMLSHFDPAAFVGIVLDESSILKSFNGIIRKQINTFAKTILYRLACTATPAPNDIIEITNHAEFLDIMSGKEIIALFFTQDGNTTHNWRLKGHAKKDFWQWMASWAVAMRRPSDLGFDDDGYLLPPVNIQHHIVETQASAGHLFAIEALTLQEQQKTRRETVKERVQVCADLVNSSNESWIVWCDLNNESQALTKAIPDAVEITGSDSADHKTQAIVDFIEGRTRVLVSKPSICGFGVNLQMCHNMAFVGVSHSFEQYYQAVRREWRFGQKHVVNVHLITSAQEGAVIANLERKEREYNAMMDSLVSQIVATGLSLTASSRDVMDYTEGSMAGRDWTLYLGDCVEQIQRIADNSVGLTIFSPPFPGMYAYSNSVHDIGNTQSIHEMVDHFKFLIPELLRVSMPGRMCCIHLTQLTAMKSREGYIGIHDYRGRIIQQMIDGGWVYHGEVTINKNPQVQAVRNKERGLLFKSLAEDSAVMRMALADYLIYFRKPGENPRPIHAGISKKYNPDGGWITEEEWIEWAQPVWNNIRETDVLNVVQARETDDERHLCPLQLPVIERAIKLWSTPGDIVFDPFNGIGSTGYQAIKFNRQYVGIELKRSYYDTSIRNLQNAVTMKDQPTLFDIVASGEVH